MNAPLAQLTAPVGDLQMYIDGAWVDSQSGARMTLESPGTGDTIGSVPESTPADAERAIAAAAAAEETLRWMTPAERSAMCKRVVDALGRHKDELARVIALDQGKPYHSEAKWEAGACTLFFREASEDILRLHGETLPSGDRAKRMISFWQSRGTYAVVTPWNFPYNIPSEYISAALAAGNPIVWVPAPTTSACAVAYARALAEADLPQAARSTWSPDAGRSSATRSSRIRRRAASVSPAARQPAARSRSAPPASRCCSNLAATAR